MSDPFSAIACAIEAYPYEGGSFSIQGGQLKSVTVTKSLRGGADGRFSIELAPGGPSGPESVPDWTQVITPGSHVLIGMSRGDDAAIVMDGVATSTSEEQSWVTSQQGSFAGRSPAIVGSDFAWFFNSQNWYLLSLYGLTAGLGIGDQLIGALPPSLVPLMSKGLIGTKGPVQVGLAWFDVMCGPSGMLNGTFVPYAGGNTRVPFSDLIGQTLEQYLGVYIPITEQFLGVESWMAKFMDIFPWPWYEFFVTTAPSGFYTPPSSITSGTTSGTGTDFSITATAGGNLIVPGTTFSMKSFPNALPVGPQMVARVNPVPRFDFTKSGQIYGPSAAMDSTRWNALPLTDFTKSAFGFYDSNVQFSSDEVRNFYLMNPTAYQTAYGESGTNVIPFAFKFLAATDPASIHRYGFKPADATTRWLYDWNGTSSQKVLAEGIDMVQSVATLTAALASWWHPLPLMLRGQVTIPLTPSIRIGTRFRYAPFKNALPEDAPWDFYVEEVTHRYVFGGQSATILTLTRGLPSDVYADSGSGGLLRAIYTGNARRQDGVYMNGLPAGTGEGLQVFSTQANSNNLAGQMSATYVTPQAPSQ